MKTYLQMLRLFSREIRLYMVSTFLVSLAWDGLKTVILNLFLLRLGHGPEFVGLINGSGALAFAIICPLVGAMGTWWGSRNMLIAGLVTLATGFALLPLAILLPEPWGETWLLATYMFTDIGLALYLVNGLPFMMSTTTPRERTHVFSVQVALGPMAAFAGSLIAGMLPGASASLLGLAPDSAIAYALPLWLAGLCVVFGIPALLRAKNPGTQDDLSVVSSSAFPLPPGRPPYGLIIIIAIIMALRFGGRGTIATFTNMYLDDALGTSTALIGALSAAGQLLSVPAALLAPLFVARIGNLRLVFWGTLATAASIIPMILIPNAAAAGLTLIGSTAAFSLTVGPIRVFSQELVTPRWRAPMASSFMMGAGLAFSGMALVGGYVIAHWGYATLFFIGAILTAVSSLTFWLSFRVPRGEMTHQTARQ